MPANKKRRGLAALATLGLVCVALALSGSHPAAVRGQEEEWVPMTLIYHSDVKGKIEPCG